MSQARKTPFFKPALLPGTVALLQGVKPAKREAVELPPEELRGLKKLLWLYFWLLIFEGALRKWIFPQYSAELLIVRDPVVLLIYALAWQKRIVPQEPLFRALLFLSAIGLFALAFQLLVLKVPIAVLVYGYRTAFLHLPLIFLVPYIFSYRDLLQVGKVILLISIPMSVLMAVQFQASPDAWLNRTVGTAGGYQLASAGGKIRPPGTFSFISGAVAFYSLVTAILAYGLVSPAKPYPKWLLVPAAIGLGLAVAVSGSRATMLSGLIVVMGWLFGVVTAKKMTTAFGNALLVVILATFVLGRMEVFVEGAEVLEDRFQMGAEAEAERGGLAGRFLSELTTPIRWFFDVPLLGWGLGVGTNVGAAMIHGKMGFLLSEGEWGRNLLEMGPLFGFAYILFRVRIALRLGRSSLDLAKRGHLLPLVLFSACAVNLVCGQIAQPTTLGFTVFTAALCATAVRTYQPSYDKARVT